MDKYDNLIPSLEYFACRYCTKEWVMKETVINFHDMTYVHEGSITYYINGIAYRAKRGDLIYAPIGSRRCAEIDKDNPPVLYAVNMFVTDKKDKQITLPFAPLSTVGVHEDIINLYNALSREWAMKKTGYVMKTRSLLLDILYHYFEILYYKNRYIDIDPRIEKAIMYIYREYKDKITSDDLAGFVGMNSSYFGTLFKKETGCNVKEFINRIRINNAENLIACGNISLKEAALECGFEDQFYFSKVFKTLKGYSPSKVMINTYIYPTKSR